jgi:hypothetical protein
MKTAMELKENALLRVNSKESLYIFSKSEMKAYEKQLCAEQRHECQIEHNKRSVCINDIWYVACDDVRTAKQPET